MAPHRAHQPGWTRSRGVAALVAAAAVLVAQQAVAAATGQATHASAFTLSEAFTFLFLTIGPLKIIGPFAAMTRGQDPAFKRLLAVQGTGIAAIAALAASTIGASVLRKWGISVGALLITIGILLFMVALRTVMEQYEPPKPGPAAPQPGASPSARAAFSPLAFPTIIPPYGVGVLVVLVTLHVGTTVQLTLLVAAILALDLLAMLSADAIVKQPMLAPVLGIVGTVAGVLQVALGVQAIVGGLRALGIVATPAG